MSAQSKSKTPAIVHQPAPQLYERFVAEIKHRIRTAQIKAALAANAELVLHYWEIGRDILASQKQEGWGTKLIDRLAADLQREFPTLSGYSSRNLKYMRAFAEAWPDRPIVQQLAAQLPWAHNCVLLDRVKDAKTREFYIRKTIEHAWSCSVLVHQLDSELHKRAGRAPTNFALTLPPAQSDLAREMIKDPFIFKPAPLDESAHERALENALLARLKDFLIELGSGFAFVGEHFGNAGTHIVLTPGNFFDDGGFKHKGDKEKWYNGPIPTDYVLNEGDLIVAMSAPTKPKGHLRGRRVLPLQGGHGLIGPSSQGVALGCRVVAPSARMPAGAGILAPEWMDHAREVQLGFQSGGLELVCPSLQLGKLPPVSQPEGLELVSPGQRPGKPPTHKMICPERATPGCAPATARDLEKTITGNVAEILEA